MQALRRGVGEGDKERTLHKQPGVLNRALYKSVQHLCPEIPGPHGSPLVAASLHGHTYSSNMGETEAALERWGLLCFLPQVQPTWILEITPGTMTSGTPQEHMGQTVPHLISRQLSPTLTVSPEAPT